MQYIIQFHCNFNFGQSSINTVIVEKDDCKKCESANEFNISPNTLSSILLNRKRKVNEVRLWKNEKN